MTAPGAAAEQAAEELLRHRSMLFGLAYRLLGSAHDADDVLQEAYLRWTGVDRGRVAEPRRYLTRIVAHLAMDRLRVRQARRESYVGPWLPEPVGDTDPLDHRESVSLALLHLLERLTPPERAVYVLRTAFDLPYEEIAQAVGRQPDACRQLLRRARAAVETGRRRFDADATTVDRLLTRFLAAAREGDVAALIDLLHADATAWTDGGGRVTAARNPILGASKVARFFGGIYRRYPPSVRIERVRLNGAPAAVVRRPAGHYVVAATATGDRISDLYIIANPAKLTRIS